MKGRGEDSTGEDGEEKQKEYGLGEREGSLSVPLRLLLVKYRYYKWVINLKLYTTFIKVIDDFINIINILVLSKRDNAKNYVNK